MTRSNRFPVSSFGADLHAVLREGANREIRLVFDTPALCTRFNHRINALRAAMKREQKADWEQLYRCGVHKDVNNPRVLILSPRDSEFRQVIADSGVATVAPIPPKTEYQIKTPSPGTAPKDPAEDFLSELRDATTVPKK